MSESIYISIITKYTKEIISFHCLLLECSLIYYRLKLIEMSLFIFIISSQIILLSTLVFLSWLPQRHYCSICTKKKKSLIETEYSTTVLPLTFLPLFSFHFISHVSQFFSLHIYIYTHTHVHIHIDYQKKSSSSYISHETCRKTLLSNHFVFQRLQILFCCLCPILVFFLTRVQHTNTIHDVIKNI